MLADDNQSILHLLMDYFSRKDDIEVVATVSDGAEIADAVREHAPDILVMDIIMPRRDGFMALEELSQMDLSLIHIWPAVELVALQPEILPAQAHAHGGHLPDQPLFQLFAVVRGGDDKFLQGFHFPSVLLHALYQSGRRDARYSARIS